MYRKQLPALARLFVKTIRPAYPPIRSITLYKAVSPIKRPCFGLFQLQTPIPDFQCRGNPLRAACRE